ncbi:MAG TPA: hypothetical protein VG841_06035 [Caulobacterales bacterium]|nr:hypothetical protein [Caulobacterales bacterium]
MRARLAALLLALTLSACGFGMKDTDIPGVYHAARGVASETLTLYSDNTYLHEWSVNGQEGRATGGWRIHMLGYGFAQIRVLNYRDRIDPDAREPGDWDTDVRRSSPWDTPRIQINAAMDLYYVKDRAAR